jgi:hypothetical protein
MGRGRSLKILNPASDNLNVDISGANISQTALRGVQSAAGDDKRAQLQMLLLKRALDDQNRQAAEVSRQLEGKGNVVDIKV